MSRAGWFILGIIVGVIVFAPLSAYLFAKLGGIAMASTSKPLPFEKTLANTALHASIGNAAQTKDPLPADDANLLNGARVFRENCAVCHGVPGRPKTSIAAGEFPPPPQLFEQDQMVVDDPEGVTHWKISHGIRLSGMPGFANTLSDTEQWQVTMLLARADHLTAKVKSELGNGVAECSPIASH